MLIIEPFDLDERLAQHPFSEQCDCLFCIGMLRMHANMWPALSETELDAMHRIWVPGRHRERTPPR